MEKGDEGVCLAATVGQLELADGLVGFAGEALADLFGQLTEIESRVGKGEEFAGVGVDGRGRAAGDIVEVGGEEVHGEVGLAQLGAECDDLVPGLPGELAHGFFSPLLLWFGLRRSFAAFIFSRQGRVSPPDDGPRVNSLPKTVSPVAPRPGPVP